MVFLTPALFMAQVFWGPQAALPLMSATGMRGGVSGVAFLSFSEAFVAALPFGILFGCLLQPPSLARAAFFAFLPSAAIFCFALSEGLTDRLWWIPLTDALFFVALFSLFSLLGGAIRRAVPEMNYVYLGMGFLVLTVLYTFVPHLYLSHVYGNPV